MAYPVTYPLAGHAPPARELREALSRPRQLRQRFARVLLRPLSPSSPIHRDLPHTRVRDAGNARKSSVTDGLQRIRTTARRVKRWDDGTMVLRWVLVGVLEAERGFRRLKGYVGMPALIAALRSHADALTTTTVDAKDKAA